MVEGVTAESGIKQLYERLPNGSLFCLTVKQNSLIMASTAGEAFSRFAQVTNQIERL